MRVRAQDGDGERIVIEASGLEARVIQHEMDHLDGVLILDRAPRDQRREAMRALREREDGGERYDRAPCARSILGTSDFAAGVLRRLAETPARPRARRDAPGAARRARAARSPQPPVAEAAARARASSSIQPEDVGSRRVAGADRARRARACCCCARTAR